MTRRAVLMATPLVWALSGCVVWEIRDEMRGANARLTEVKQTLDTANASLADANTRLDEVDAGLDRLDRTNTLIDDVGQGLSRIDQTNVHLERLAALASIEQSLSRLDGHLAAVRKTIGSIDTMIPFLDLGGDEEEIIDAPPGEGTAALASVEEAEVAAIVESGAEAGAATERAAIVADAEQADAAGAGDDAAAGATARAAQRREPLLGVWIQRYPEPSVAIVILSSGRYLRSSGSGAAAQVQEGRWVRNGSEVVFTPAEAAPPAAVAGAAAPPSGAGAGRTAAANPATAGPGAAGAAAPPTPWRISIISGSMRTLAIRYESGAMAIFGRP